ncbi:MAG: DUF2807 domain-containing protein [Pseudomonadota bacterium]
MKSFHLLGGLLCAAAMLPAYAASAVDITVRDFAGAITLVEGSDGVEIVRRGRIGDLDYSDGDNAITIDGGLSDRQRHEVCKGPGGNWDLSIGNWNSKGDSRLEDYPEIVVSVPKGSDLTVRSSTMRLESEVDLGNANLKMSGCFDMVLRDLRNLSLEKSGSGDVEMGDAERVEIKKSGSGDVFMARVGSVELEQSGSGNIEVDRVLTSLRIEKSGSGDVEIAEANGRLDIDKSGSGDVTVDGGRLSEVVIDNSGSGDVEIDAPMEDADVSASGSGDIFLHSVSGVLHEDLSGAADLTLGKN